MLQAYRINATFIVVFACGLAAVGAQAQTAYDIMEKTIPELQAAMESGTVTARQLVEIYLARIAAYDKRGPALNAMVALNPQALAVADQLDAERRAGRVRGPLHGIPLVVKDNYETIEMPTTAGSIALAAFHPRSDAFQVRRLKDAGAVIIGKTNMHELAAGTTTISSSGGQTKIRTTSTAIPEDQAAERVRLSPRTLPLRAWEVTPAAPFGCPPLTTTSSGCVGRAVCRAGQASSHFRARRTSVARSRARSPISRSCSMPPLAATRRMP